MYRRSALDRVGLLDEDFWAYHEDVDLNFRMQLAGYKSLYVPEAIAYHAGSVTGKQFGDRSLLASGRNRWFVLYKNLPAALWMRFAYRLARRQAQVAWWWIKGNAESRVRCRGALSSLQYLGRELRKRRAIMRLRRASATELAQMFRAHERLQRQLSEIARNQK